MKMQVNMLGDVKGGTVDAQVVSSDSNNPIADIIDHLSVNRGVLFADEDGALFVYSNDQGCYCCEFHRNRVPYARSMFTQKDLVRDWLTKWIPQTGWRAA